MSATSASAAASPSARSADLVVLGAGPAGLAVARHAARAGHCVVVLERSEHLGGLAGSFEVAGIRVDHGSHRLHPATPPDVLADLRTLLGDDLQTRPRNGRLRVWDHWVGFPLRPAELARTLPPAVMAGIARDALARPLRRADADTFAGVLRTGLGPELYDALYAPYAQKLWGLPGEQIDAEQARVRVTAASPWAMAARTLRPRRDGQGQVFHYPRRGFGQIVDALAASAADAGADIRTGVEATALRPHPSAPSVVTADGSTLTAGRVLSTVPLTVLARLAGADTDVSAAASALSFRAMLLVYLVHEGGRWSGYDAHYLPGPQTPVTRVSEPLNYRVSVDDPADRTVLCAEIPCAPGDTLWSMTDDELADLVEEGLAATGLPPVRRAGVVVRRARHVYPVYGLGYGTHLHTLDTWARALPGVTTFGRLGLYAHDNTHHALVMARDAAACLRPDGWDDAAWAAARDRFATHVVED